MSSPLEGKSNEEIKIFFAFVGEQLFCSLPISRQAGHAHPRNTIRDYYHSSPNESELSKLACEFLVDFVKMRGGALIDKWFGTNPEQMFEFNRQVIISASLTKPS